MHKRIIQDVVKSFNGERSTYFEAVLSALDRDSRTLIAPNILYAVLREIMPLVPPYLPTDDFINRLFGFVRNNSAKIMTVMFSSQYVTDHAVLQSVTNEFVDNIIEVTYQMHEAGTINTGEEKIRSFSWPYDNADFPFAD